MHDLCALKLIPVHPENKRTSPQMLQDGLRAVNSIVVGSVHQITEAKPPHKRRRPLCERSVVIAFCAH